MTVDWKRLAAETATCLATLLVLVLLWKFHVGVLLFLASLALASAVRPSVDSLEARGLPRALALVLTYVVGVALTGLLLYLVGTPMLGELRAGSNRLTAAYEHLATHTRPDSPVGQLLARVLPPVTGRRAPSVDMEALFEGAVGVTLSTLDLLTQAILVTALSLYWALRRGSFERILMSLLQVTARRRLRALVRALARGVGDQLRSDASQSVLGVLVLSLGYHTLGLEFWALPAVAGALARFVPLIGGAIAVLAGLLAGLAQSTALGVCAAGYSLAVVMVLELVVSRRMFLSRRPSAILRVVTAAVLAEAYGVAGLIAAPSVAATLQAVFESLLLPHPAAQARDLGQLAERMRELRELPRGGTHACRPSLRACLHGSSGYGRKSPRGSCPRPRRLMTPPTRAPPTQFQAPNNGR
jgi:predicted PurR-regulated permease PerM